MRSPLACLIASALLASAASASAAVSLPGERERWRAAEAGGFTIYSNSSDRDVARLAANLQHMRDALGSISRLSVRSPRRIKVFLFDATKGFVPYAAVLTGRTEIKLAGAFTHGRDAEYIILDGQRREASESVAYHELTHFFVHNNTPGVPLWFNEGLAVFYSTFDVVGGKVKIGRPETAELQLLREHGRMPIERLLSVTPDAREYTESGHAGVFYAESWAFVHYLLLGAPQRKGQLTAYLAAVKGGASPAEAVRSAFGCDFSTLENELGSYLQRQGMQYRIVDLSALPAAETARPAPLSRAELLFQLGDLLAQCHACDLSDARAFLAAAAKADPSDGRAPILLDQLAGGAAPSPPTEPRRPAEPARGEAQAPPPDPVRDDLVAAEAIVAELVGARAPAGDEFRAKLARARELFQSVLARNPRSTIACNGLARTYLLGDADPDAALAALEHSLALDPTQPGLLAETLALCVRTGGRAKAGEIVDRLVKDNPSPGLRRECEDTLAAADANEGARLVGEGKTAEGVALLRRALAATSDPDLKSRLADTLAKVDADTKRRREVDLFNEAAAKARSGDLLGAYRIVDALVDTATDAEVAARARSLRAKLLPYLTDQRKQP